MILYWPRSWFGTTDRKVTALIPYNTPSHTNTMLHPTRAGILRGPTRVYSLASPFTLAHLNRHPDIIQVPNRLFYDGDLIAEADIAASHMLSRWEHLPAQNVPLIFQGICGADRREASSPSWFNVHEVEAVVEWVGKLLETRRTRITEDQIGIIAPYQKQVQKIRQALEAEARAGSKGRLRGRDPSKIMVGSVEQFQGQEKLVVIISTVRASQEYVQGDVEHSLGFLVNEKRFNVAVTRAKALLIVVGHPGVLSQDESWRAFLDLCVLRGACMGEMPPSMGGAGSTGEDLEGRELPRRRAEGRGAAVVEGREGAEYGIEGGGDGDGGGEGEGESGGYLSLLEKALAQLELIPEEGEGKDGGGYGDDDETLDPFGECSHGVSQEGIGFVRGE